MNQLKRFGAAEINVPAAAVAGRGGGLHAAGFLPVEQKLCTLRAFGPAILLSSGGLNDGRYTGEMVHAGYLVPILSSGRGEQIDVRAGWLHAPSRPASPTCTGQGACCAPEAARRGSGSSADVRISMTDRRQRASDRTAPMTGH